MSSTILNELNPLSYETVMNSESQGSEVSVPVHLQSYYENGRKLRDAMTYMGKRISNSGPDCKSAHFCPEWSEEMLLYAQEHSNLKG